MLVANRASIGAKLDLIQSYWEPAKERRLPRARDLARRRRQAKLVLWEEASDCAKGSKTEFKAVLDRR